MLQNGHRRAPPLSNHISSFLYIVQFTDDDDDDADVSHGLASMDDRYDILIRAPPSASFSDLTTKDHKPLHLMHRKQQKQSIIFCTTPYKRSSAPGQVALNLGFGAEIGPRFRNSGVDGPAGRASGGPVVTADTGPNITRWRHFRGCGLSE